MGHNKTGNMAHIADLMAGPTNNVGLNNYKARTLSPQPSNESMSETIPAGDERGKEKYVWRIHQPSETRKYQLFPAKDKLSIIPGRNSPDPERAFALAISQPSSLPDRAFIGATMRVKTKEQSLLRRRKPSVSDLGPMTTVQEAAMDSPTIPGRPPIHERSASAPGSNSGRRNACVDAKVGPALEESAETRLASVPPPLKEWNVPLRQRSRSGSPRGVLSPKSLAPLVIPTSAGPTPERVVAKKQSESKLDSPTDTPPSVPPKSARMLEDKFSPQSRTPFTPLSGSTYASPPSSTTNLSIPSTATPVSASDGRVSPFPILSAGRGPSPMGHSRGQSDTGSERTIQTLGHRREQSEASIIDRGRPKKRVDGSPITTKYSSNKRTQLAEQKALEKLPEGIKASDAQQRWDQEAIDALQQQAMGQAAKFEVLRMKDVESLSRELRALDERCEYLRKTHHSLRSGRRNLHERICTFLRSPRTAQFSHSSLLKQEEALIDLDLSIDDWLTKLEQAENRRMRVRQKLLEHVAAAVTMPRTTAGAASTRNRNQIDEEKGDRKDHVAMAMIPNRHIGMGEETPPRSPAKERIRIPSPDESPERLALSLQSQTQSTEEQDDTTFRMSKESIRIYADSDVYALLADVEAEMNRMSVARDENLERLPAVAFTRPVPSRTASPIVH